MRDRFRLRSTRAILVCIVMTITMAACRHTPPPAPTPSALEQDILDGNWAEIVDQLDGADTLRSNPALTYLLMFAADMDNRDQIPRINSDYSERWLEWTDDFLAQHPHNLNARLLNASGYLTQMLPQRALELTEAIITDHPGCAMAYSIRGFAFEMLGIWNTAEASYGIAVHKERALVSAYVHHGTRLYLKGETTEGLAEIDRALELNPSSELAFMARSAMYQSSKDWESAITDMKRAIDINPGNPLSHLSLGRCYRELGRMQDAVQALGDAVTIDSSYAPSHYEYASALEALGEVAAAADAFDAFVSRTLPQDDSTLLDAYRRLGKLIHAGAKPAEHHLSTWPRFTFSPKVPVMYLSLRQRLTHETTVVGDSTKFTKVVGLKGGLTWGRDTGDSVTIKAAGQGYKFTMTPLYAVSWTQGSNDDLLGGVDRHDMTLTYEIDHEGQLTAIHGIDQLMDAFKQQMSAQELEDFERSYKVDDIRGQRMREWRETYGDYISGAVASADHRVVIDTATSGMDAPGPIVYYRAAILLPPQRSIDTMLVRVRTLETTDRELMMGFARTDDVPELPPSEYPAVFHYDLIEDVELNPHTLMRRKSRSYLSYSHFDPLVFKVYGPDAPYQETITHETLDNWYDEGTGP